jgi:hypothetical protein
MSNNRALYTNLDLVYTLLTHLLSMSGGEFRVLPQADRAVIARDPNFFFF